MTSMFGLLAYLFLPVSSVIEHQRTRNALAALIAGTGVTVF